MDYRWKVTNTGRRSPGTRVPMVAQILQRNVHVVMSMLPSAAATPSSVMKSRLFIHVAQRVSGDGSECPVMVAISASVHPAMASRVTPAALMDASGTSDRTPRTPGQFRRSISAAPRTVPEEQDVHADHDGYQREYVKHDGCLSSHPSFLLAAELEPERRYGLHR